ncbi:DUF4271 domain-containing protein, partial [Arthrospira platensis SPKY1]|nr:DUF4271 domain-containing protein [Arthrospira platensis SPKY1]
IIAVLGAIFPIQKETRLYNFTIIIFTIMLGVLLLGLNMFIAYMPAAYTQGFVYAAFAAIASLYLFRALRGLIIGQQFVYTYLFHFLLYLCAVEIAPVVVLARLIKDAAGT